MLSKFQELFRGSALAHGTWDKSTGNMATVQTPPTEEQYRNHLEGKQGLGIIPVTEDGKCYFGAIDIDIDTIDHKDLYDRVRRRNLPLSVCRSKSGGAHLLVFFRDPHPSTQVQALLKKWAGLLGFPAKTEIFPKQTKSTKQNLGNWINLCYFNSNSTVRYAMGPSGSLGLEEFLDSVQYYTGDNQHIDEEVSADLIQIDQMPPCLKELTREGLPAGTRNVGLFNFGVFYRKSSPNGWQDKVRHHNQNYLTPPLNSREVEALIKSINDRTYQYQCDSEPLCSYCDRKTCLTLPYGVGHKPWEDDSNFDEIVVTNLRKILTDPPTYILEVNGKDLHLSTDEFRTFEKLRRRVFEMHDAVIRPMKQAQWDQKMRGLLSKKEDIEAPEDASESGAIMSKIDEFLALSERAKTREDLLRGTPILENGKILFRVDNLQKYLYAQKINIDNNSLFALIHRRGCAYDLIKIKGKAVRAWSIPVELVNRQTEDYTEATFEVKEPEL